MGKTRQKRRMSRNWKAAITLFEAFLAARGLSPRTKKDYSYVLGHFSIQAQPDLSGSTTLRSKVLAYMTERSRFAAATYNTVLRILRTFFRWAVEEGILSDDPTRGLRKRRENPLPRCIDENDIIRLLHLPFGRSHAGMRDRAAIHVMLDNAVRPSELSQVSVTDVDCGKRTICIRASIAKTRISRVLPISNTTATVVSEYIAARGPALGWEVPLFCTDSGRPMTRHLWAARFGIYSQRLGVKIRPYDLRHTAATLYLRAGGNAFALRQLLGHSSMAMSSRYVTLSQVDLQQVHELASPIDRLLGDRVQNP